MKRTTDGDGRATEPWRAVKWAVARAPGRPGFLNREGRAKRSLRLRLGIGRDDLLDLTGFQNRHFDEEFEHLGPQLNSQVACFLKLVIDA